MNKTNLGIPINKNCGLCGYGTCEDFINRVKAGEKEPSECPFFKTEPTVTPSAAEIEAGIEKEAVFPERDIHGRDYDFVVTALPGEVSARKIVLPFRPDMVEKMNIVKGDIVMGRPMGAGCPIPHVLKVIKAEKITGLLYTCAVGPKYSRENEVKDVEAYHMVGFEGIAENIRKEPSFGERQRFLPGFCMMTLSHTGVVNMVLQKKHGLHVRIEDIRIM